MILLTYDAPHRKTQDVAVRMLAAGMKFKVVAVPWVDRKPRRFIYAHRPAELTWPCDAISTPEEFFGNLGVEYQVEPFDALFAGYSGEVAVVGGAGILPKDFVESNTIVNIHPGLLPSCRGLDTLKWSIMGLKRVGVTAHVCDEFTDLGWRLIDREVPVFTNDTFHSFAMRQYETELDVLVPSLRMLENCHRDKLERIDKEDTEPTRRMPVSIESGLLDAFHRYKLVYAK